MDAYEWVSTIGEGTYGVVMHAIHTCGQSVAIKRFKESDEDELVRKTALREVRILKQLRHDNIVQLLEVFRRKRKLYLVFEFCERTLLEEMESHGGSLDSMSVRRFTWQMCRALQFLHGNSVMHRDIKPENLLISTHGVLKLCDFGFARALGGPGARYSDYVATRWYRSPELLCGSGAFLNAPSGLSQGINAPSGLSQGINAPSSLSSVPSPHAPQHTQSHTLTPTISSTQGAAGLSDMHTVGSTVTAGVYGTPVDVWALGCVIAEMATGLPLFPGDSDADQMRRIAEVLGDPPLHLREAMARNPLFQGVSIPHVAEPLTLASKLGGVDPLVMDVVARCLKYEPLQRITAAELLRHPYLAGMDEWFLPIFKEALDKDAAQNVLGRRLDALRKTEVGGVGGVGKTAAVVREPQAVRASDLQREDTLRASDSKGTEVDEVGSRSAAGHEGAATRSPTRIMEGGRDKGAPMVPNPPAFVGVHAMAHSEYDDEGSSVMDGRSQVTNVSGFVDQAAVRKLDRPMNSGGFRSAGMAGGSAAPRNARSSTRGAGMSGNSPTNQMGMPSSGTRIGSPIGSGIVSRTPLSSRQRSRHVSEAPSGVMHLLRPPSPIAVHAEAESSYVASPFSRLGESPSKLKNPSVLISPTQHHDTGASFRKGNSDVDLLSKVARDIDRLLDNPEYGSDKGNASGADAIVRPNVTTFTEGVQPRSCIQPVGLRHPYRAPNAKGPYAPLEVEANQVRLPTFSPATTLHTDDTVGKSGAKPQLAPKPAFMWDSDMLNPQSAQEDALQSYMASATLSNRAGVKFADAVVSSIAGGSRRPLPSEQDESIGRRNAVRFHAAEPSRGRQSRNVAQDGRDLYDAIDEHEAFRKELASGVREADRFRTDGPSHAQFSGAERRLVASRDGLRDRSLLQSRGVSVLGGFTATTNSQLPATTFPPKTQAQTLVDVAAGATLHVAASRSSYGTAAPLPTQSGPSFIRSVNAAALSSLGPPVATPAAHGAGLGLTVTSLRREREKVEKERAIGSSYGTSAVQPASRSQHSFVPPAARSIGTGVGANVREKATTVVAGITGHAFGTSFNWAPSKQGASVAGSGMAPLRTTSNLQAMQVPALGPSIPTGVPSLSGFALRGTGTGLPPPVSTSFVVK